MEITLKLLVLAILSPLYLWLFMMMCYMKEDTTKIAGWKFDVPASRTSGAGALIVGVLIAYCAFS